MQPFIDVAVQPIYGQFRALLTWQVDPKLANGHFRIFRSYDGVNDWKLLSESDSIEEFVDENLIQQGKLLEQYYRIEVTGKDGSKFTSPSIGTFGTCSRQEFGVARTIMDKELQVLRRFTLLHVCKLRANGEPCHKCVIPDTDQAIGVSVCDTCFGTIKEGGFFPPVVSWGRFMSFSPTVQLDSQEGTGTSDPVTAKIRMIAFPLLRKNDMLVDKRADRRYLVNQVQYSRMGGKIPIVAVVDAMLLSTSNPQYLFPV